MTPYGKHWNIRIRITPKPANVNIALMIERMIFMKKIVVLLLAFMMCFSLGACRESEAAKAQKTAAMARQVTEAFQELDISITKLSSLPITSSQYMIDKCTDLLKEALEIMKSHDVDPDDEDYIKESEKFIKKVDAFNDKVDRLF